MRPKTQSEKIAEQNKKAVEKMREGLKETAHLHELVRQGKLTAAQALQIKCKRK